MNPIFRALNTRFRKRLAAALLIGLLAMLWGCLLPEFNFGLSLRRASYDLPFLFREHAAPQSIVIVALDESTHRQLGQPIARPWDRRIHGKLVEKLTAAGARMIVFDILFHDGNVEQDPAFAAAMRSHGNVVLIGEILRNGPSSDVQDTILLATPELRRASVGWGLTEVPIDSDGFVRRILHLIPTDLGEKPSLAEFIRKRLQAGELANGKEPEFLNYYGPAGSFTNYSYGDVLSGGNIRDEEFRDKIVIVGSQQNAGLADAGKDMFPTPYLPMPVVEGEGDRSRKVRKLTSGMEIQATAIANLIEGRRIRSLPGWGEFVLFGGTAFLLAGLACLMRPPLGILAGLAVVALLMVGAVFLQRDGGIHFHWTIPAFGQMPFIMILALGGHYFIEYAGRWRLRRAFRSYMSEEQARLIDEDSASLEPGGREVEATILFSDLAGFTTMSEDLPPQALSKALICYFERVTEGILGHQGTIIKYIGDAVLAIWGAPLKMEREADRAIEAAIQMQVAGAKPIPLELENGVIEQVLETRVGINSGTVLAGNLGCSRRFDYTVIGDAVNTAARLEGLNKMLGTSILVAEAVLLKCAAPERFLARKMGSFVMKGKKQGIVVFEILGFSTEPETAIRKHGKDYLDFYQAGIDASMAGDPDRAEASFRESLTRHDRLTECPASRLHLDAILANRGSVQEWRCSILLDSK